LARADTRGGNVECAGKPAASADLSGHLVDEKLKPSLAKISIVSHSPSEIGLANRGQIAEGPLDNKLRPMPAAFTPLSCSPIIAMICSSKSALAHMQSSLIERAGKFIVESTGNSSEFTKVVKVAS
jgi:hypothetical protein